MDVFSNGAKERLTFFNEWLKVEESFEGLLKYDVDVFKMHPSTFEALKELQKEGLVWTNPLSPLE